MGILKNLNMSEYCKMHVKNYPESTLEWTAQSQCQFHTSAMHKHWQKIKIEYSIFRNGNEFISK